MTSSPMRTLVLAATLTLFGFASGGTALSDGVELRISTPNHGVVVDTLPGQDGPVVLAGPRVSIVVPKGVAVHVNDLDQPGVSARIDREKGWTIWEGSYEVELVEGDEVKGRFRIQEATMVLGHFEQAEGWTTEGD